MVSLKELDDVIFDLYCSTKGAYTHERELFVPSEVNVEKALKEINELREKVKSLKESLNNEVWVQHLLDLLDGMEIILQDNKRHPAKYIRALGNSISRLLEEPRRYEIRAEILSPKLSNIDQFFKEMRRLCLTSTDPRIDRAIACASSLSIEADNNKKTIQAWAKKRGEKPSDLKKTYKSAVEGLTKLELLARRFVKDAEDIKKQERKMLEDVGFAELLEKRYGLDLEWILSWYQKDFEEVRQKVRELAAEIDPTKEPIDVLKEHIHVPYDTPEEMFAAMKQFLETAREKSRAYIDLPDGESCRVIGVKEIAREDHPMGHSGGPDPVKGRLVSTVSLNQYNFRAFTRGWLMMMAIHEAYPGHNIQWTKVSVEKLPRTFKVTGGKEVPLVEGLAHRSEELLQHIYGDKAFPLFVAWRRFQTILRVYIEMGLFHLKTMTPEEAARLYMDEMDMSEETARGLVVWHLENRGYNVCYYTGYRMLTEMRDKTLKMSEKDFNNKLFSAGFISMKNVKTLLGIEEKLSWE
jgi:hypothetical protein